jgi:hypothetical protein
MFRYANRPRLDPEQYKDRRAAYELASLVSNEIEALRAIQLSDPAAPYALRGLLSTEPEPIASFTQWPDFLTNLALIRNCSERLTITPTEFLERVMLELHPPNWETLLYMKAWWRQAEQSSELERRMRDLQADRERVSKAQTAQAVHGGNVRHEKVYGKAKAFVLNGWGLYGQSEYEGNKSAFARVYARLVQQETGCQVTEQTIAASWLKGH